MMSGLQRSKVFLLAAIAIGCTARSSIAQTFDASADFSFTDNPNGVWRYGWSETLGSEFNLFSQVGHPISSSIDAWNSPELFSVPSIEYNNTGTIVSDPALRIFQPGQVALHPGSIGQYSILRWIAPEAGDYTLNASFMGLDTNGGSTDVNVLLNGESLFGDFVVGFGAASMKSFANTIAVSSGDIVDFAVGYGQNFTFWNDTTGVNATISKLEPEAPSPVPEPTSIAALATAISLGMRTLKPQKH